MYSSEREYVEFDAECDCSGQVFYDIFKPFINRIWTKVEVWLNRVMDSMRSSIRSQLSDSVVTYEEKAREKWLFDYAAQPVSSLITSKNSPILVPEIPTSGVQSSVAIGKISQSFGK